MISTKHKKGDRTADANFHADVPVLIQPVIVRTKTIQGEMFYVCERGKLYRPALFDAMFKVKRGLVLPVTFKGTDPHKWRV